MQNNLSAIISGINDPVGRRAGLVLDRDGKTRARSPLRGAIPHHRTSVE
jgi:hypothetical protein